MEAIVKSATTSKAWSRSLRSAILILPALLVVANLLATKYSGLVNTPLQSYDCSSATENAKGSCTGVLAGLERSIQCKVAALMAAELGHNAQWEKEQNADPSPYPHLVVADLEPDFFNNEMPSRKIMVRFPEEVMTAKNFSRREMIVRLGALGMLGAAYYGMKQIGLLPIARAYAGPPPVDYQTGEGRVVVILGAGVAGLCAAYLLRNTKFKITVIEPNSYVGGRCLTLRKGDIVAEEQTDRLGRSFQPRICDFDKGADLYFNAGASRIPQSHSAVLHYCKKLKIKLQPYIFACRSNLLQNDNFNQGKPVPLRWIKHDLRGHIAEMLSHFARTDRFNQFVTPDNLEAFLQFVQHFGDLSESDQTLKFLNTRRGGFGQKPGAGLNAGVLRPSFDLKDLLETKIWQTGLFNDMYLYWQSSLMQAEGGMDRIPRAFRENLGPNTRIQLNVKATGIRRAADKILIHHSNALQPLEADYCISTMAPPLLAGMLDGSFPPNFKSALSRLYMVPACKVGWQARRRFWEEDDEIFGGISWTKHIIRQIWYPSQGFHSQKGILTGAYNYGDAARTFGLMSQAERLAAALEGGEKLHPGRFAPNVEKGLSIAWHHMPNQAGGWAYYRNQAENPDYLSINETQGRLVLAGDYISFLSGWMEGAVRSAEHAVKLITLKENV